MEKKRNARILFALYEERRLGMSAGLWPRDPARKLLKCSVGGERERYFWTDKVGLG